MSNSALNTLQTNAARFTQRLQETISESTRDLSIGPSSTSYFESTTEEKIAQIKKQLDSNSDRERLDALKRLIAVNKTRILAKIMGSDNH